MKRIIRLTESELTRVIRRIINEQPTESPAYQFETQACKPLRNTNGKGLDIMCVKNISRIINDREDHYFSEEGKDDLLNELKWLEDKIVPFDEDGDEFETPVEAVKMLSHFLEKPGLRLNVDPQKQRYGKGLSKRLKDAGLGGAEFAKYMSN